MEQFRLQERGRRKCALAPDALYTADALEMASSAATARLHASLLPQDGILLDIAAGIGADAVRLAERAAGVICIEADPVHALMLRHNLETAQQRNTLVLQGRAEHWLPLLRLDRIRGVFADPARRDGSRRVMDLTDVHPPLALLDRFPSSLPVLVKIAPGVPPPQDWGIATVAVGRECREQLLHRNCTLPSVSALHADADLRWQPQPSTSVHITVPRFLIEPHAAIIRTGHVADYLHEQHATVIDPHIAYGWSEREPSVSPWHQAFRIIRVEGYNRKRLRRIAAELDFSATTEIKKRGFPDTPEDILRQLKLRGSRPGVIILTRQGDGHLMIFAERMEM
ncbi:MAG: hypothetical protein JXA28_10280 [Bacteroidetes bacterium]|nr:hypothetical protein [Bacteroidota bacterium]